MRKAFTLFLAACMFFGTASSSISMVWAQTTQSSTTNLIKSGNFDNGIGIWGHFTTLGGKGTVAVNQGQLEASIQDCGTESYSMQVNYDDFKLYKNGKYVLKFDISSTVNRQVDYRIQLNSGDYRGYVEDRISTTPTMKTITKEFTMLDETDKIPRLAFNLGNVGGAVASHQVRIDNVQLYLVDDTGVVYEEEDAPAEEKKVVLNQIGYKPEEAKLVVFRGAIEDTKFSVVSVDTGAVVYEGNISNSRHDAATQEDTRSGDFSEVKTPGTYKIVTAHSGESYSFEIGDNVYQGLFKDAFKMFYMQRCGQELSSSLAGKWSHPTCHTTKAKIYGTNETMDVSGGWHDAGDYGRYVVATSKAVADLLLAYGENKAAFTDQMGIKESGNGVSDLLDEVKGQLDWMLKMQNQSNGGVYHKVTCANFPGYVMPQEETGQLILSPISTTATADFAAIMAMGYETYKDIDAAYANKCLAASKKAWSYLEVTPSSTFKNPPDIETGEYGDTSDRDERYWAAAQLFKATGEGKYHDAFKNYVNQKVEIGFDWGGVGNYGNTAYLKAASTDTATYNKVKANIISQANDIVTAAKNDSYGVSNGVNYYWGSNMSTLNNALTLITAYEVEQDADYLKWAKEHLNYCLGKNSLGLCYVTGYGSFSPENPHHRPSIAQKEAVPGMLVGGPNGNLEDSYAKAYLQGLAPAKCYLDHVESYSTNETDIYWNSPLVATLTRLDLVGDVDESEPGEEPGDGEDTENGGGNEDGGGTEDGENPDDGDGTGEVGQNTIADIKVVTTAGSSVNQTYTVTPKNNQAIDLSKFSIKYYYTKEDTKPMSFWCDSAAAQLTVAPWYASFSNVTGTFGSDADGSYLEIKLNQNYVLQPNTGSVQLQVRYANNDWSNISKFTEKKMVLIYDGKVYQ